MKLKRIDITKTFRPTPEAREYAKWLKNKKVFERVIDAYLFAAAFALKNDLEIFPIPSKDRQHIVVNLLDLIDDDVCLALEAAVYAIRKRNKLPQPNDSDELIEIISQYAEAGIIHLKQKWQGKIVNQIQDDICKILN
ncbi:hypothetical protein NIES4102_15710 [Chondrocystis sp. NIES-4102]|nr:hypothetical protein NIES4102_15710 [Chondrocystis sp. NIES-4102]